MKQTLITLILLAVYSSCGAFGGDSSAGGEAPGQMVISTGYAPGAFSVSAYSSRSGVIGTLLKYYLAAGASSAMNGTTNSRGYTLASSPSSWISDDLNAGAEDTRAMRLSLTLKFADVGSIQALLPPSKITGTQVNFHGDLAEAIYAGMDKSGVPANGYNLDDKNQVIGKIMNDGPVSCSRPWGKTLCSILVGIQ